MSTCQVLDKYRGLWSVDEDTTLISFINDQYQPDKDAFVITPHHIEMLSENELCRRSVGAIRKRIHACQYARRGIWWKTEATGVDFSRPNGLRTIIKQHSPLSNAIQVTNLHPSDYIILTGDAWGTKNAAADYKPLNNTNIWFNGFPNAKPWITHCETIRDNAPKYWMYRQVDRYYTHHKLSPLKHNTIDRYLSLKSGYDNGPPHDFQACLLWIYNYMTTRNQTNG